MKAILQSVGDETIAFGDQCYWVADNVKRFLGNFQPNMEVEVTVKDIDGTPMVTFLKKSGFPTQPAGQKPAAPPQQAHQAPAMQPPRPPMPASPTTPGLTGDVTILAAALIVAYNLDVNLVKTTAAALKGL